MVQIRRYIYRHRRQDMKDSSHGYKYLRKIKPNLRIKVDICISTYSNADVVCHSATCRTKLNERNSVRQIVDGSLKLTLKNHFKLMVGHTTKQIKSGRS